MAGPFVQAAETKLRAVQSSERWPLGWVPLLVWIFSLLYIAWCNKRSCVFGCTHRLIHYTMYRSYKVLCERINVSRCALCAVIYLAHTWIAISSYGSTTMEQYGMPKVLTPHNMWPQKHVPSYHAPLHSLCFWLRFSWQPIQSKRSLASYAGPFCSGGMHLATRTSLTSGLMPGTIII